VGNPGHFPESQSDFQPVPKSPGKVIGRCLLLFLVVSMIMSSFGRSVWCRQEWVFLRDDFNDLEEFEPLYLPGDKIQTKYTIEKENGEVCLKAVSRASASGLIHRQTVDVYRYPRVRWRWKVSNTYEKGDARFRSGDDYPLRIDITFTYDPRQAGIGEKIRYNIAKALYGQYPPHSSLGYIWANRKHPDDFIISPYTERARMIPLQTGPWRAGRWILEEVDVLQDYRRVFEDDPPRMARIAIMNDSDDTGEASVSYVDFIEVYR
jgi:hypothetical protein